MGVSPPQPCGVSPGRPGKCCGVLGTDAWSDFRRALDPGVGVRMTPANFFLELAIHALSFDSHASRYSCLICVSSKPGKKSRAIMWDKALLYMSSSRTVAGRLIRFGGGGGGGISWPADFLTSSCEGVDAMFVEQTLEGLGNE